MSRAPAPHLSQLSTRWSLVRRAHADDPEARRAAVAELLAAYQGAIRGYLGRLSRGPEAVDELYQEFAVRLCGGKFGAADPGRGRFRDLLATALRNLARDHHARKRPVQPAAEALAGLARPDPAAAEDEFLTFYRQHLFRDALDRLADDPHPNARVWAAALRLAFADPAAPDAALAARLGPGVGPLTPGRFRKRLWEARRAYARHLVRAVADTLDPPTAEALADELEVLGVLDPCRAALGEWAAGRAGLRPPAGGPQPGHAHQGQG
jgi:hypothetical protein